MTEFGQSGLQNCPYNEARLTVSGGHQTGLRWTIVTRASGRPTLHPRLASRTIRRVARGPRATDVRVTCRRGLFVRRGVSESQSGRCYATDFWGRKRWMASSAWS